jgi:hypothetical protein
MRASQGLVRIFVRISATLAVSCFSNDGSGRGVPALTAQLPGTTQDLRVDCGVAGSPVQRIETRFETTGGHIKQR